MLVFILLFNFWACVSGWVGIFCRPKARIDSPHIDFPPLIFMTFLSLNVSGLSHIQYNHQSTEFARTCLLDKNKVFEFLISFRVVKQGTYSSGSHGH